MTVLQYRVGPTNRCKNEPGRDYYLGGQHSGVGRGLVTIGLHLHASGDTGNGLTAGQIGNVDESVVEAGIDVSHAKDNLSLLDLGAKGNLDFLFLNLVAARHS